MKLNEWDTWKRGPKAGQPRTLTDRVIRWMVTARGAKEQISRSFKYRTFIVTDNPTVEKRYFIGSNGAVRTGKSISSSISITDQMIVYMKDWERRNFPDEIY